MTPFCLHSPDHLFSGRYRYGYGYGYGYRYSSAYINVDWNIQWPIAKLVINMEHPA